MKKFFTIALIAATSAAFASERAIYDIQYLPAAGTTYGFTEMNHESRSIEANRGDLDIDGLRISQTIGHSFTDRLTVNANVNYFEGERDPKGGTKTDEDGLSDLGVNARLRMIDEAIRFDILGGIQYEISESRVESGGDVDNRYLSGGDKANIGVQVGEANEKMQWAVLGRYIHNFKRDIDFPAGDLKIEANRAVQTRADLLNKIAEKSLIRSHLTIDFIERTEDTNGSSFQGAQTNFELGAEYQHLFSQDLLGRVGVDYRMSKYESADLDLDNTWIFHVAANYQF